MRWPEEYSKRSRIVSRSRKPYQNIEIASHTRWDMIRLSSRWMTRRYCARLGTSTSSSVSVAPQNAIALK